MRYLNVIRLTFIKGTVQIAKINYLLIYYKFLYILSTTRRYIPNMVRDLNKRRITGKI